MAELVCAACILIRCSVVLVLEIYIFRSNISDPQVAMGMFVYPIISVGGALLEDLMRQPLYEILLTGREKIQVLFFREDTCRCGKVVKIESACCDGSHQCVENFAHPIAGDIIISQPHN